MNLRKLFFCFAAAALMFLAACAETPAPAAAVPAAAPAAAPAPAPAAAPAAPAPAPAPAAADEVEDEELLGTGVPIIIYTNHAAYRTDRIAERAAEYGFNIQAVSAGGGAIMERLISERHSPIAHIVYGLNVFLWNGLIENDVVMPYVPVWADRVEPRGICHPDGYYHFAESVTILLVYDPEQLDAAPTDWFDLWQDERFHGRYQFEINLGGATTRKVIAGILGRHLDPDGYLGVSDEGWEHIAAFYRHGIPNAAGIDLFANIADPDSPVAMGQMGSSGVEPREEQFDIIVNAVNPAVGVPLSTHNVGVVANNDAMEETLRFLNWFTPEIREELRADDPPQRYGDYPMQVLDWDTISRNIDSWVENIYLNYLP